MYISYKPLWHTLVERNMRKEDLRLAAGLTTNMIANMGKEGKHISMETLVRICETLDCRIMDVIELVSDEPSNTGGNDNEQIAFIQLVLFPLHTGRYLPHHNPESHIADQALLFSPPYSV